MTTSSVAVSSGPYQGDGGNRVWTRDFLIYHAREMKVVLVLATGDEVEYLHDSGAWSTTGLGAESGTVTFPLSNSTAAATQFEQVRIDRAFIADQDLDLAMQARYNPEEVERALDRRQFNEMWLRDRTLRQMTAPVGYTGSYVLPTPQALYALGWNETATALTNFPLPSTVTAAALRAVVDATDLVAVGITIPLDGVQDAAPTLQAACDYLAARGGALLTVRCPDGGGIRLAGRVRGATGVSINFVGCKVYVGEYGGFSIRGNTATTGSLLPLALGVTAGDTTILVDTSPLGGSSLSSFIAVGASINVTNLYDSALTDLDRSRYTVTAVNNGTGALTLNRGSDYTYDAGYVALEVSTRLTSDTAEFDRTIPVTSATMFAVGDWVVVEDARTCPQAGGGSAAITIRTETALIIDITGLNVTLSRKLEHDFDVANYARMTKISPVVGCEISGAAIVLAQEDGPLSTHIFDFRYAIDCRVLDCTIDHDTSFSRPSNNFRISHGTFNCGGERCQVLRPRYYTEGQGYCFRFAGATSAYWIDCAAFGGRTGFLASNGATDCSITRGWAHDQANKAFDCHGQAEYTISCFDCIADGSNVNSDGTRYALAPGNPTHLAGTKRFTFQGGRITYRDSGDIVLYACPPTEDVVFQGTRIDSPYRVFSHFDVNGGANLVSTRIIVRDLVILFPQEWVFYGEGKRFGSTSHTLDGFYASNLYIEGGTNRLINIDNMVYVWFNDIHFSPYTIDGTFSYSIYADDVADFKITNLRSTNCKSGFSLANVTNLEVEARWRRPASASTVINDRGGNSGIMEWTAPDHTPTYGTTSGVIGGITFIRSYPTPP